MQIELGTDILPRLRKALRKAGSREVGGMLFAEQSAAGHFRIVDFSLDLHSGSRISFQRDPTLHNEMLAAFFDKTGRDFSRFNYLGEWHSHPSFPIRPSQEDIDTMTDLVGHNQSRITFAPLLIVRLRLGIWVDYSITIFAQGYAPYAGYLAHRLS